MKGAVNFKRGQVSNFQSMYELNSFCCVFIFPENVSRTVLLRQLAWLFPYKLVVILISTNI